MKNVVDRVKNGEALWTWRKIKLESVYLPGTTLEVFVMRDAMRLQNDKGQWVRFSVTAVEQQQIADMVNGIFHTERTQDARHEQADVRFKPIIQVPPGSGNITALASEEAYSQCVDDVINKIGGDGIVSSIGKPWTLTNNMSKHQRWGEQTAYNYGWHDTSGIYTGPGGLRLWQPVVNPMSKHIHNNVHKDPSQVCEFLSRDAVLVSDDGAQSVDLAKIYQDSNLCKFVTYDGKPLEHIRQPAVPEIKGVIVLPPVQITP